MAEITEEQLQKVIEPIPFTPTKRLERDDVLYVTEENIPHPIIGYAESHKEYSVIDLRGYRKGYEPRLEISGIYTPDPEDIFRLQTGKLPPYQPTTTGDKLLAEMRRLGVHKAFRIGKPEEVVPPKPQRAFLPEIEREAPTGRFAVFLRDMGDIVSETNFTEKGLLKPKFVGQLVSEVTSAYDKNLISIDEAGIILEEYIDHPLLGRGEYENFIDYWRGRVKPSVELRPKPAPKVMGETEIAQLIASVAPKGKPPAPAVSVVEYDRRYTLEELREKARQEGLSASGSKKELAAKLIARGIK